MALLLSGALGAQFSVRGTVADAEGSAVSFASVALYTVADSSLRKVESTADDGTFLMQGIHPGHYRLVVSYLGAPDLEVEDLSLREDAELGTLTLAPAATDLAAITVTGRRALVEVKSDRTVFNVQGTINAAGNDAIGLLQMSPGVTVDNNDNISVLSRSGVIVYVDGRRLPLTGSELGTYLRSLTAEQIDRIDIISSPGARYEAQGNAGIIDIRLRKADNEGANAGFTTSASQGRYAIYALNANANYRNRHLNVYATVGYSSNESYTDNDFWSVQNGFELFDEQYSRPRYRTPSVRFGTDFYLGKRSTLGLLYGGQFQSGERSVVNRTEIYRQGRSSSPPDSILLGGVDGRGDHTQNTFNLNYNYAIASGHNLNLDLDYGRYRNDDVLDQPNRYVLPNGEPLSAADAYFETPTDIDIFTARADYDFPLWGGGASAGAKFTGVSTDNTFLSYAGLFPVRELEAAKSNQFTYDENVVAAYLAYAGRFSERVGYSAGLRVEATDARGLLTEFVGQTTSESLDSTYLSLFPTLGLTYNATEKSVLSLRYGRRINRPNYNVLNPFRVQLNELSFERGNPSLGPEIVDNVELGLSYASRYQFKLAYSHTAAAIARLFSPDDDNPRAGFATYDNLAAQDVLSLTASAPVGLTEWWNAYVNATASYIDNRADYGSDGSVDVGQFNYRILLQQTFSLPGQLTAELTGLYVSAGVSEGIFEYDDYGLVNFGLQRQFLDGRLNAKVSVNDIFRTVIINGRSYFNGLLVEGRIQRDSRRAALSLSYNFGNQKVTRRSRDTGLDDAAGRVD